MRDGPALPETGQRRPVRHHLTHASPELTESRFSLHSAEGVSIRALAAAVKLSSSRVHQIVAAADLDELDAALGELRAAGWPAPEDPDGDDDAELDGRDTIADRLLDEAGWLRQCADWLMTTRQRSTCVRAATILSGRWW